MSASDGELDESSRLLQQQLVCVSREASGIIKNKYKKKKQHS
jgi:hypothetical protein